MNNPPIRSYAVRSYAIAAEPYADSSARYMGIATALLFAFILTLNVVAF